MTITRRYENKLQLHHSTVDYSWTVQPLRGHIVDHVPMLGFPWSPLHHGIKVTAFYACFLNFLGCILQVQFWLLEQELYLAGPLDRKLRITGCNFTGWTQWLPSLSFWTGGRRKLKVSSQVLHRRYKLSLLF